MGFPRHARAAAVCEGNHSHGSWSGASTALARTGRPAPLGRKKAGAAFGVRTLISIYLSYADCRTAAEERRTLHQRRRAAFGHTGRDTCVRTVCVHTQLTSRAHAGAAQLQPCMRGSHSRSSRSLRPRTSCMRCVHHPSLRTRTRTHRTHTSSPNPRCIPRTGVCCTGCSEGG